MTPTVKNLTLIGLIFEGISLIFLYLISVFVYQPWLVNLLESELADGVAWLPLVRILILFMTVLATLFMALNLYLFIPIVKGQTTAKTGATFLYQAIYGAVNLAANQILGILYLVAGILGYNQIEKDKNPVREGL